MKVLPVVLHTTLLNPFHRRWQWPKREFIDVGWVTVLVVVVVW
jgi:hypothetical protein